jgi:flagellar protein FlaG
MSADSVAATASAVPAAPSLREAPQAQATTPSPKAAAAAANRPANVSVPKVDLKAPEKPALQVNVAEKQRNLEEAIRRLNDQMRSNNRDLAFAIDRKVDRTVITVRSAQSGEVVRQIPDDAVLRVAHSIEDIKGLLLNASA